MENWTHVCTTENWSEKMAVAEIYARNVSQFGSCFSCDIFSSLYSCSLLSFLFARAIAFRVFFWVSFAMSRGKWEK